MPIETKQTRQNDARETVGDLDPEREVVKFTSGSRSVHLPEHVDECNSLPPPSYARWSKAATHFNDTPICKLCQRAEQRKRAADDAIESDPNGRIADVG